MKRVVFVAVLLTAAARGDVRFAIHPDVVCKTGETIVWMPAWQAAFDSRSDATSDSKIAKGGVGISAIREWNRFELKKAFKIAREERLPWNPDGQDLSFFGLRGDPDSDYGDTIRVIAFRPAESLYAVELKGRKKGQALVLYMPKEGQPMSEAISWVNAWRNEPPRIDDGRTPDSRWFSENDELRIPQIQLQAKGDLVAAFAAASKPGEVSPIGKPFSNAGAHFVLHVDGTGVRFSPGMLDTGCFGPEPLDRRFWFDRPFFLFLWDEGEKSPRGGVWFGDTTAFVIS